MGQKKFTSTYTWVDLYASIKGKSTESRCPWNVVLGLGTNYFSLLTQPSLKMLLSSKVVQIDQKMA